MSDEVIGTADTLADAVRLTRLATALLRQREETRIKGVYRRRVAGGYWIMLRDRRKRRT